MRLRGCCHTREVEDGGFRGQIRVARFVVQTSATVFSPISSSTSQTSCPASEPIAVTLSQLDGTSVPDPLQPTVTALGSLAGRDVWLVLLLIGLKTVADVWTTKRATRI